MEVIHMMDVVELLDLPRPPNGRSSYYISCPCCDDNPRKKHLNINLMKDVFRCPRCGFSGGIFDLYAHYAGINRANAREILLERLNIQGYAQRPEKAKFEKNVECPLTDIDTRHATYSALLDKLSLAGDHRENLIGRGLNIDEISRLQYKTTPIFGMTAIAKQLISDGYYLAGVPGFYRDEAGNWSFVKNSRGIMIPVRDVNGRIQGIQIRRDNVKKRKFRWVSSIGKEDGCSADGWTHLAGKPKTKVILTEGPMKADVISFLTGQTVLAVPGINAITQLEIALNSMRALGTENVMTAFDMDFLTNPHVENGYRQLCLLLEKMGFKYGTYTWDSGYKGLDDYIWQYLMKNNSDLNVNNRRTI